MREARTVLDAIKSRTPGLSQTLFARRDIWGEPIESDANMFSPVATEKIKNDPVNQTLMRLGVFPAKIGRTIRGVELTEQQYDDFSRIAGRTAKARLDAIVNQPGFDRIPDEIQTRLIENAIKSSRESTRAVMMMQPGSNIIQEAVQNKLEKLPH
jgi:hypothetical protein